MATNGSTVEGRSKVPGHEIFLVWGAAGWIAGHLVNLLKGDSREVFTSTVRMEEREQVREELDRVGPTHVLVAAGCTGRPNVDWCEDHKLETVRSNVIGTLNIVDVCAMRGVHCTVFATGCIYQYDEEHPWDGPGFVETDPPNFFGSFYSLTKAHLEEVTISLPFTRPAFSRDDHADRLRGMSRS